MTAPQDDVPVAGPNRLFAARVARAWDGFAGAYRGHSVWPVASDAERDQLQRVAMGLGSQLETVRQEDLSRPSTSGGRHDEFVACVGQALAPAASFYARLTGRTARVLDHIEAIEGDESIRVLFIAWEQLTSGLLETVHGTGRVGPPVGLMVGDDLHEVRMRCLTTALRVQWGAPSWPLDRPGQYTALLGHARSESALQGFDRTLDASARARDVRAALRDASGLLAFAGHSDGIDASLSHHAVLCPRLSGGQLLGGRAAANCDCTSYCHRLALDRAEALEMSELISPSELSSHILAFLACYAVRPADSVSASSGTLLRQLLANQMLGALIAPWELAFPQPRELSLLAEDLKRGLSVGQALYSLNHRPGSDQRACNRYVLFGDPEIRLAQGRSYRLRSDDAPAATEAPSNRLAARSPFQLDGWLLWRLACARRAMVRGGDRRQRVSPEALGAAVATARGRGSGPLSDLDRSSIFRAVVEYDGSGTLQWFEDASAPPQAVPTPCTCPCCRQAGRVLELTTTFGDRWLATCARCELIFANVPVGGRGIEPPAPPVEQGGRVELPLGWSESCEPRVAHVRTAKFERHTWIPGRERAPELTLAGRSWIWLHAVDEGQVSMFSYVVDHRA